LTLVIKGMGTAVPVHSILQSEAAELWTAFVPSGEVGHRTLRALFRRSGVKKRHSVILDSEEGSLSERQAFYEPARDENDYGPTTAERMERYEAKAPHLAVAAARGALENSSMTAEELTHLVTVSCTGFFAPGVDAAVVDMLGLPRGIERTHVGFMGCHGALNGLRVASSFTGSDPEAKVLVCAVELCTLHLTYGSDAEDLVANAIFGDGAAALVGVSGNGRGSNKEDWGAVASGTHLLSDASDAMTWRIGTHGFRMTLSPSVPDLIEEQLADWLTGWLGTLGLGISDIASWAVHPGGPRILQAVEGALHLSREDTSIAREVLSDFGNMSSPTILFILERMRIRGAPRPCVAMAFGPGLVVEAALFL
jgi:predicted naringenin-chalcone synthase